MTFNANTSSAAEKQVFLKQFLLVFLPFAILLCALLTILYYTGIRHERAVLEAEEKSHIRLGHELITNDFKSVMSDLLFLTKQHELIQFLEQGEEFNLNALKQSYLLFSEQKGVYDQVHFLDNNGIETVRVNLKNGKSYIVPEDELQHKEHHYYFKESLGYNKGEVYLSPFDLNVERGEIEKPAKSVIRFATPIFDKSGKKQGVLILNYLGSVLVENFLKAFATFNEDISFLNSKGYWLHSVDPENEFGFMYEDKKDLVFGNTYPDAWKRIKKDESGQFYNADGLFTFKKIYSMLETQKGGLRLSLTVPSKECCWILVSHINISKLNAVSEAVLTGILKLSVLLFAILAIITLYLAKVSTTKKQAQQALRESDAKVMALSDSARDAIVSIDENGYIKYWNPSAEKIFGYSKDEVIGKKMYELIIPKRLRDRHVQAFEKFQLTGKGDVIGKTVELMALRKDGSEFPVEISISEFKLKGKLNVIAILRDITERKQTEEARKRDYLNLLEIMMVAVSTNHTVTFINNAGCKILGHEESDIIGKNWFENFLPKRSRKESEEMYRELKSAGSDFVQGFESPVINKEGEERSIRWNNVLLKDDEDNVMGTLSAGTDISDQKQAEFEIIKNYQNQLSLNSLLQIPLETISMQGLLENALDVILSVSWLNVLSSTCVFLIDEDEPETLVMRAERGLSPHLIKACAHIPFGTCLCGRAAQTGKILFLDHVSDEHTTQYKGMKAHGHYNLPIMSEGKVIGVICLYLNEGHQYDEHEVTFLEAISGTLAVLIRRKQAEEEKAKLWNQFLQSQKLESIGRLTGGLAHDFNNLLTSIIGYSEVALDELPDDHPVKSKVERVRHVGKKASNLINQMLAFSRKQVLNMKVSNLNTIVENMSGILTRMIGEDVILKFDTYSPVKNVMADENQTEQVLMNLVVNGRYAMPDGGTLTIKTKDVELDKEFAKKYPEAKAGSYVMLSVKDTGTGMSPEVREQIFEPFFTTKEKGKGTGLGLSTVFGIVEQHGGFILVDSELDKGTIFKVYLPAVEGEAEKVIEEEALIMAEGDETLLVVEDDESIRKLFVDILTPLGYNVLEAGNGEEATKVSDRTGKKIDLLLADVVMPGMNGWELSLEIKKKRPDIKTVFTSGFVDNPIVLNKILDSKLPFIKKPLSPRELVSTLREVLDGKKG
jgi:PAS domain S-box-containing protein